jgi:hypothetical protein
VAASYVDIAAVLRAAAIAQGEVHLVGSGAHLIAAQWPDGLAKPIVRRAGAAPEIEWVARLAAVADAGAAPAKPLYLRAPDARVQEAGRLLRR